MSQNSLNIGHQKSQFPTSSEVNYGTSERVSQPVGAAERKSEASSTARTSKRTSEWKSDWLSIHVPILMGNN